MRANGDYERSHKAAREIPGLTGDCRTQKHDAGEAETMANQDYTNGNGKRRQDRGHEYKDSEIEPCRSARGEKDRN